MEPRRARRTSPTRRPRPGIRDPGSGIPDPGFGVRGSGFGSVVIHAGIGARLLISNSSRRPHRSHSHLNIDGTLHGNGGFGLEALVRPVFKRFEADVFVEGLHGFGIEDVGSRTDLEGVLELVREKGNLPSR